MWYDTARRKHTDHFFILIEANDRSVGLRFHEVQHLSIPEETLDALVDSLLEYEVLVVIADLRDVSLDHVIQSHFPTVQAFHQALEMIYLALSYIGVEYSLIYFASDRCWHASLGILN